MKRMDMHMHSIASDGCKNNDQLIIELMAKDISLFALTDHDTFEGVEEMVYKAKKAGLTCLPGVEVSSTYDGMEFHLLVYNFDKNNKAFRDLLQDNLRTRQAYDVDLIEGLIAADTPRVSRQAYDAFEDDPYQGGWRSINYLKSIGLVVEFPDYLNLCHCIPPMKFHNPQRVIQVAHQAGGTVVLAHPSSNQPGGLNNRILDDFIAYGLDGIECYSQYHKTPEEVKYYLDYCKKHDLLVSGGSDYHGGYTGRRLGHPEVTSETADYEAFMALT